MSCAAVKQQMKRYNIPHKNAFISDKDTHDNIDEYIEELEELKPEFVIVDSLQLIMNEDYSGMSKEDSGLLIIQKLRDWVEKNDSILIMIGHVTKEGDFEGRNTIQHLFDTHLEMKFDKKKNERTLSWAKNRKGPLGMLYYEFGKDKMNFYTPVQWKISKENLSLNTVILNSTIDFIQSFKTHDKYKELSKSIKKEWGKLTTLEGSISDMQLVMEMGKVADTLLKKYGIIQD